MKRWIAKLAIFVVLGAIINVAVAWGCASFSTLSHPGVSYNETSAPRWLVELGWRPLAITSCRSLFMQDESPGSGVRYRTLGELRDCNEPIGTPAASWAFAVECFAGWPCRGLWGACIDKRALDRIDLPGSAITSLDSGLYLIENPDECFAFKIGEGRILPLLPIWPGFAINTIFYAAILWMMFCISGAIRRRLIVGWRIKRGLCAKCGYDLRAGQGANCPECGTAPTMNAAAQ